MKKIFLTIGILIVAVTLWAQSPEKMSYQAVIRNNSDELVVDTEVGMQISVLQGSASGSAVYVETQTPTSNENGLITIEIGGSEAVVVTGDFSAIDWSNGTYFLKTQTDPAGGTNYTISGTSQLLSVPYALHAKTAETLSVPFVEVDGSITNEIQDLQLVGDILTITMNGAATEIDLSAYLDNEIQDLQLIGDTLTITNNSSATEIDLSKYIDDTVNIIEGEGIAVRAAYPNFQIFYSPKHYVGELIGTNGEDGVVFWVDHTGEHGLICSPEDLNGTISYGDIATVPGGATSEYDGYSNTIAINDQTSSSAAGICLTYSTPGTSAGDWYLPAIDEISKIYHVKYEINKALNINSFSEAYYWSSTELSNNFAWYYHMEIGYSNNSNKNSSYGVRAIRAF
jgi:hypothetical protein